MALSFYQPVYDITADAGVRVFANSLEELVCNSVKALVNEMVELEKVEPKEELTIEVESAGFPYTLPDILNEVLYLFDVKKFVPSECEVLELSPNGEKVKLKLKGETYNPEKHGRKLLIKAATYQDLKLERKRDKYEAQIIFDI